MKRRWWNPLPILLLLINQTLASDQIAQLHAPPNSATPLQMIPINTHLIPSSVPYLLGSLAYTVPDHACAGVKIMGPASHWQGRRLAERIVLVDGAGGCTLETKVNNIIKALADIGVMDHGLSAVVVKYTMDTLPGLKSEGSNAMSKQQQPLYDVPILLSAASDFDLLDSKVGKPATIHLYKPRSFDQSLFVMWALAVFTTYVAANQAVNFHPLLGKNEGESWVDEWWAAIVLVAVACTLGLLSIAPGLVFKLLQLAFMVVGGIQVCSFFHSFSRHRVPMYKTLARNIIHQTPTLHITAADLVSWFIGLSVAFLWYSGRMGSSVWLWQDLLGVGFAVWIVRSCPVPDLTIAANLLSIAWMYNIFWVYYQMTDDDLSKNEPPLTETNAVEPVPFFLRIPNLNDRHGGESILGLGDILFPALLIAFAKAWDQSLTHSTKSYGDSKQRRPYSTKVNDKDAPWWLSRSYFSVSLIAYAASLFLPYFVLVVWNVSFPPMLVTIPAVFGVIMYVGQKRRELEGLWGGSTKRSTENGNGAAHGHPHSHGHGHASGDEQEHRV